MSSMVLGLDVGDKRIGLASASTIARLPSPYGVIDRGRTPDAIAEIRKAVNDLGADTLVVGLPRDMNGQETEQTAKAREFAARLDSELGLVVVMQDEAVTSLEAEKRLKQRGKPYDKGDIDAEAATMILDDYLSNIVGRTA